MVEEHIINAISPVVVACQDDAANQGTGDSILEVPSMLLAEFSPKENPNVTIFNILGITKQLCVKKQLSNLQFTMESITAQLCGKLQFCHGTLPSRIAMQVWCVRMQNYSHHIEASAGAKNSMGHFNTEH